MSALVQAAIARFYEEHGVQFGEDFGDSSISVGKLEMLISSLQSILVELKAASIGENVSSGGEESKDNHDMDRKENDLDGENKDILRSSQHLVQIKASKSEIERRINAFINHKRSHVDSTNQKEFCTMGSQLDKDDTCARTDSIFTARSGSKSHVQVKRVRNYIGPQTTQAKVPKLEPSSESQENNAVEERLKNMEDHLGAPTGDNKVPISIFERISTLENKILFLEGLSPEYFKPSDLSARQHEQSQQKYDGVYSKREEEDISIPEIDEKIAQLRASLLFKKKETAPLTNNIKEEPQN